MFSEVLEALDIFIGRGMGTVVQIEQQSAEAVLESLSLHCLRRSQQAEGFDEEAINLCNC